ncbi:uncharacterized protein LOC106081959 [Stomoxys calcitrans]|uniref:uncharacterized protein LOC106081959 n=1 Tax=Stomoxys calcitrans TaxID=35570 RepID=UPI0027E23D8A|nr:uncharacterized protein LOC106081959 [Stomoxys calcitrans]
MKILVYLILLYFSSIIKAEQWCTRDIYDTLFWKNSQEDLHVLVLWFPVRESMHSNLTMCSSAKGQPIQRHCMHNYESPTANATWTEIDKNETILECTSIINYCFPMSFKHVFMSKNKVVSNHTNSWLPGQLGEYSRTKDLCLLENGLPLTRKCIYNPLEHVADWERRNMSNTICLRDTNQHIVTHDLDVLYKEVQQQDRDPMQDNPKAINKLADILTKENTVRIAADLRISTSILKEITTTDQQPEMVPKILAATDLLLKSNESVVTTSVELGTPTQLIKTVDNYVDKMANVIMANSKCPANPSGVIKIIKDLVNIFYINPLCSNISGIAFYNFENPNLKRNFGNSLFYDSDSKKFYRYLYLNQSQEDFSQDGDIEAAVYLPEEVYKKIVNDADRGMKMETMVISLYRTPNFFIDETINRTKAENIVLKLSIPNFKAELPGNIPQIFQRPHTNDTEQPQCVSWDLKTWISSGFALSIHKNLVLCHTKSITSFGAILGLHRGQNVNTSTKVLTVMMDIAQDFVSLLGCCLSLIGLCCIWITAMCCKRWRSDSSNKFLLNMCLVLTLLMSYFLFINLPDLRNRVVNVENLQHCIIEGAFLQYIILVLFLWMLFLAILQYQRYVTVVAVRRSAHFMVNYMLTAWSVPIIPTALVILFDNKSYTPLGTGDAAICYPTGLSFYITVLLPISLMSLANLTIFVYILCSLRNSMSKFHHTEQKKKLEIQVRLSILLFFLLGISWLFGILAHVDTSHVLSMLFCLTSTLQGFVLFVYFVVIDKIARDSWLGFFSGRDYYTLENSSTATSPPISPPLSISYSKKRFTF